MQAIDSQKMAMSRNTNSSASRRKNLRASSEFYGQGMEGKERNRGGRGEKKEEWERRRSKEEACTYDLRSR